MIRPKPLTLKDRIRDILEICEKARAEIDGQLEIIKAALDAGAEEHGLDPGAMRRLLAHRRQKAKDPAKVAHALELDDQYRFMAEGGAALDQPKNIDNELDRVMNLASGTRPPKIDAIKKALGCSQGKAHKLRSLAAARLAMAGAFKSSSSSPSREHEHLPGHDPEAGEIKEYTAGPEQDAAAIRPPFDDAPQAERTDEPPATPVPDGGVGVGTYSETALPAVAPGGGEADADGPPLAAAAASNAEERACASDIEESAIQSKSCGGVESRHAGPGDQIAGTGDAGERTGPERLAVGQAGVAPGPQDPMQRLIDLGQEIDHASDGLDIPPFLRRENMAA